MTRGAPACARQRATLGSVGFFLCVVLAAVPACSRGGHAPPDAPDVTLLSIDALETGRLDAFDRTARAWRPARHWADRPLSLALPSIAVAAEEAGYATHAVAGDEPPGLARELPFVFETLERAAEIEDLESRLAARGDGPRFLYAHVESLADPVGLIERVDDARGRPGWWIVTRERRPCGLEPGCDPLHPTRRTVPFVLVAPTEGSDSATPAVWTGHVDTAAALLAWFESGGVARGPLAREGAERLLFETGASIAIAAAPYYFLDDGSIPRVYDLSSGAAADDRDAIERAASRPELVERFREWARRAEAADDPETERRLEELRSLGYIR